MIVFFVGIFLTGAQYAQADITSNLMGYWTFNEGSGTSVADSSGNANNGTLTGSIKPTWINGFLGQGLNFNGSPSDDYVQLSSDNNKFPTEGGDWSVSTWININTTAMRYRGGLVFGVNGSGFFVGDYSGTGNAVVFLDENAAYKHAVISMGSWHHVVFTKSGTTRKIYVDTVESSSAYDDSVFTSIANRNRIGWGHGGGNLDGSLDDMRVYNRALTAQDVAELYNYSTSPTVTVQAASSISATTAILNGTIITDGGVSSTTDRGFNYGTTASYGSTASTTGTFNLGAFTQTISGLTPSTTYHYRAFAYNGRGTATSSDGTFTTSAPSDVSPTVTTQAATSITASTVTGNGTITNTGGANDTVRGFVFGPTTSYGATTTENGSFGTGAFTGTLAVSCNTNYHYAAYAINPGAGVGYGTDQTFLSSSCAPTVTISSATSVGTSTVTLNGSVSSTGGIDSTEHGFALSTDSAMVSNVSTSTLGSFSGTGSFSSNLTGLQSATTYYYRTYSTNSIGTGYSATSSFATDGVRFTLNSIGIQSITYGGHNYPSSNYDTLIAAEQFQNEGSPSSLDVTAAVKTTGTDGAATYFQHVYRSGQANSFTLKVAVTPTDWRTLKNDIYITNNDSTNTLNQIYLQNFIGGTYTMPGSTDSPSVSCCNLDVGAVNNQVPVGWIHGDWCSIAFFPGDYTQNARFYSGTYSNSTTSNTSSFIFGFKNYSSPGGATSNLKQDSILPGQTYHYTLYTRFGSTTDTAAILAPEAFSNFRSVAPSLVNYPNRRPIARWIIADNTWTSSTNPRGYFGSSFNSTNQTSFNSYVMNAVNSKISSMNGLTPRPQGILIWDMEGQEFFHYFSYVGNPNKLPDLSPEMDAIADEVFAAYRNAGYKVGVALRPSDFQTGTTADLPSTCFSDDADNHDLDDIYIATDGTPPYRGYTCLATNTWDNSHANWPFHQHAPQDDATLLANLRSKITYANTRWGATLFYIDSTVYSDNGGGNPINYEVFRQLAEEFPNMMLFPENVNSTYFGASSPYGTANAAGSGYFGASASSKEIYPNAFSLLALGYDGTFPAAMSSYLTALYNGNIFLEGDVISEIAQIYSASTGVTLQPFLITQLASATTTTSVTLNGSIADTGYVNSTARGFLYGTTVSYGATATQAGNFGVGAYSIDITGLTCNTTYHYQAYAINTAGTGYGNDQTFTTLACPVTTTPPSTVTSSSGSRSSGYIFGYNQPTVISSTTIVIQPATITKKVIDYLTPNFLKPKPDTTIVTDEVESEPELPFLTRLLMRFSLPSFSKEEKQILPAEVVFAKPANLPIYDVTDQGDIHVLQGKPIDLAVKTDKPVKEVVGYFSIKKIDRKTALIDLESQKKTSQLAAVGASVDNKLVLETFKYTDPDSDGIYTATIDAPKVHGEYDIMTILEYKDAKLGYRELHLTAVIDPEGYVYVKNSDGETRIESSAVTLLWKNPETSTFELWPATNFKQTNPQTTDKTGNYSFLVPQGTYQLTVSTLNYYDYTGDEFEVVQGAGVHENIELVKRHWWKSLWRWFVGLF